MMRYNAKPTLKADFGAGEGEVGNLENFRAYHDGLMRMDLLKDWIGILQHEYELATKDNRREMKARVKAIRAKQKGENHE
jgi:hypothetical protein